MNEAASTALRRAEEVPESRLPPGVHRLPRPQAVGRAVELAFLRWEKRDLAPTERFWRDFGMHVVSRKGDRLVARGTGTSACIAIATRGSQNRFIGPAFRMADETNLERYARDFGAKRLAPEVIPGGGQGVELTDPSGRSLWLLQGQSRLEALSTRAPLVADMNSATHAQRVNRTMRPPIEPAQIVRLGHLVLQTVDFDGMVNWYQRVLGIIPTDVQYLADGSPTLAFCRLNLGDQPADHHTLVLVGGIEEKYEHSAYEVIDLDALGQGQQVLRAQGHKHMWGIGRHVLGSQIFDYWFDPDGFEHEHYTDGDLFTADFETAYTPLTFGSIWAWGQDAPSSMKPQKSLRNLWRVFGLLRRKAITPQRLKLLGQALDAPARPWS
jgi:catechol 2,3-dioxygenase-like lactoylglutathione lyase family enzyme